MKKLLFVLFVLSTLFTSAQVVNPKNIKDLEITPIVNFYNPNKVISVYDTTVLFPGIVLADKYHQHKYVQKNVESNTLASCTVNHGPAGCPNSWANFNLICSECYRHLNIKETRYRQMSKDEYEEILKRLNNYLNK